jgi:transposase
MDLHLETLLNLPLATIESCQIQDNTVTLTLGLLNEQCNCPYCQTPSEELKRNRPSLVRDLPVFAFTVYLKVPRRQFYCKKCQKYFTERLSFVDWERRYTQRYEEYIFEKVKATSIEQISREEELSWDKVQGIFKHQFKKKEPWGEPTRVSIDEVSQRKGRGNFVTVVSDIDRGKLLEVINSHQQDEIIEVLKIQPIEMREKVKEVSVDMWGGFPKVIAEVFPNAVLVYDRFHVMKPVNEELNKIRKQIGVTIKGSRFILLKNAVDLNDEEKEKLELILKFSRRLKLAYTLKEEFRQIFETQYSVVEGRKQLLQWLQKARSVYCDILVTIKEHLDGICNYFLSRTTSGVMEGINNRIKLIKRQAYGFINFDNFRSRLLACFSD